MDCFVVKTYLFIVLTILWLNSFKASWAAFLKTGRKRFDNKKYFFGVEQNGEFSFHRNFTGVYFDPADFMKGNALAHRLDDSGVTALLEKIHTRFNTILVTLNVPKSEAAGDFSNDRLPEVFARYSRLLSENGSSISNHLNVVILCKVDVGVDENMIRSQFQEIQKLMNSANSIFPGTVDTVVLEMVNLTDESCKNYQIFRDFFAISVTGTKVGINVNLKDVMDVLSSPSQFSQKLKTEVMSDIGLSIVYLTKNFNDVNTRVSASEAEEMLKTQFRHVKSLIQNLNNLTEFALITTWADTDGIGRTNYTEFVEFWRQINDWAEKSKTTVIFHQAIDTPLATGTIAMKTNGWWRLHSSSSYLHPSQFVFEEKISVSNGDGIEDKSRVTNMTWLSQPSEFSREVVGVHFSPFALKSGIAKSDLYTEESLPTLIRQISTKFSNIFISTVLNDNEPYFNLGGKEQVIFSVPSALANWNKNRNGNEKSMRLIMTFDETTADQVSRSAREANQLFRRTVTQLIYSPSTFDTDKLLDGHIAMVKVSGEMKACSFGIKLDLELCNDRRRLQEVMELLHEDIFDDFDINVIYFVAMAPTENSKLGSGRFLPLLTVMFENCRRSVDEYFINRMGHIRVAFITGWSINGEESLKGLVQFISFWEGINTWATKTNTTVIMTSAFDPLPLGKTDEKLKTKYGWWSVKENSPTGRIDVFEDRKEAAFRYATGKVDNDSKDFSQLLTVMVISVATVGTIILVALLAVFYLLKRRQSNVLTKKEISQFFNGGNSNALLGSPESLSGPYQKTHLELSTRLFTIDEGSLLGSGAYGKVCRGIVRKDGEDETVAVKMTKVPSTGFALRGLMFEIKILSHLGRHPHIVGLVGAYTAELKKGKVFVFLEFCELGSLQNYLRECKPPKDSETADDQSDCGDKKVELTDSLLRDMARWSCDIANGMEFMTSKHIVHLDIATRNILLTAEKQVRITDFGLSRRMYDYQSYIKKNLEPLPWRSLSPESLRRSEFTEKSDVWAFGVLLWEIYSLGDEPFAGLSWDVNFPTKLERGLRLGEPTYNRNSMYSVMLRCWTTNPAGRPTFSELVSILNPMLAEAGPLSGSDSNSETPVHNYANISKSPVTITKQEIRNESIGNNPSPVAVVRSIPNKEKKIWSTVRWMWASFAVVLLCTILTISIWSAWGSRPSVTHATSLKGAPYEPDKSIEITTRSPFEAETGQARCKNSRNSTALGHKLFIAISGSGRKEEAVKVLVQRGADVNVRDNLFWTPLIAAANCSSDKSVCLRIIKFLIDNGADVSAKDHEGDTFFNKLVLDGTITPSQYHHLAVYLISKNMSKLFNMGRCSGCMANRVVPFLTALTNIEVENRTLMLFYKNGVYFNSSSPRHAGYEALGAAVKGKKSQASSFILERLSLRNQTVLHYAAWTGRADAVKFLLRRGFDINAKDSLGFTPLHEAIDEGYGNVLEIVRVLLDNGADVSIKSWDGRTPLSTALERNNLPAKDEVVQLLIDKGATL